MNNRPIVSIIIPVYNGSNYLKNAIESALNQDYDNLEIIIVNDGSNDSGKTALIAKSFGEKIKYFEKENGGVASALNYGINKITGTYFSWLSHDDLYSSNKISNQIKYLYNNNLNLETTILFSNYHLIDSENNILYTTKLDPGKYSNFRPWLTAYSYLNGCTLLFHKNLFKKVGYFNEKLKHTQDYDLWFRISYHANFIFQEDILVYSRQHPEQDSRSKNSEAFREVYKLKKSFIYQFTKIELFSNFFILFKMFYKHRQVKLLLNLFVNLLRIQKK